MTTTTIPQKIRTKGTINVKDLREGAVVEWNDGRGSVVYVGKGKIVHSNETIDRSREEEALFAYSDSIVGNPILHVVPAPIKTGERREDYVEVDRLDWSKSLIQDKFTAVFGDYYEMVRRQGR